MASSKSPFDGATNVESEHREATPQETRAGGLIGGTLLRIGMTAVLTGAFVVLCFAVYGMFFDGK